MIIGITGTLGAGKGTVVKYLKEKKGFAHYSSSGLLKKMLDEKDVSPTRANLSSLADELNEKYKGGVLHLSHERAQKEGVEDYILESIHRVSEAEYIRDIGGLVLGVDADAEIRYERALSRREGEKDNVTFEQFFNDIAREEEGKGKGTPNIVAVLKDADYVIENNGTLEELHQQVDDFLTKFGK